MKENGTVLSGESAKASRKYYRPNHTSYKIKKALGIPSFVWGLATSAVGVIVVNNTSRCGSQTVKAVEGALLNALIITVIIVAL